MPQAQELTGKRFVITRPKGRADALCERIEATGGEATVSPMVSIEAIAPEISGSALIERALADSQSKPCVYLIFTSIYAVEYADYDWSRLQSWVAQGWVRAFAIGPATQIALQQLGITSETTELQNSEGMIELLSARMRSEAVSQVQLIKGEGGRELLINWLRTQVNDVYAQKVYRRIPISAVADEVVAFCAQPVDAVVCTSVQSLQLWSQLSQQAGIDAAIRSIVVCSERMLETANELAPQPVYCAKGCDNAALYDCLVS